MCSRETKIHSVVLLCGASLEERDTGQELPWWGHPTWNVLEWGCFSHCAKPWHFLKRQRNIKKCAYYLCRLNHMRPPSKPRQKHVLNLNRRIGVELCPQWTLHSSMCLSCEMGAGRTSHQKKSHFFWAVQLRFHNMTFKHVCGEEFAAFIFVGSTAGARHTAKKRSCIKPGISSEILKIIRDLSVNFASRSISK